MTAASPLARYGAMWRARVASGSATIQLHHLPGHDLAARLIELTGDAPVDLDAPIEGVVTAWTSAPGRRVGATADLAPEWIDAVRDAEVPGAFACHNAELR